MRFRCSILNVTKPLRVRISAWAQIFFLILSKVHTHIYDSTMYLFNNINYIEHIYVNFYNKLILSLIIKFINELNTYSPLQYCCECKIKLKAWKYIERILE